MMDNKLKYVLVFGGFVILSILGYILLPKDNTVTIGTEEENKDDIIVHIEGQVNNPRTFKCKIRH